MADKLLNSNISYRSYAIIISVLLRCNDILYIFLILIMVSHLILRKHLPDILILYTY